MAVSNLEASTIFTGKVRSPPFIRDFTQVGSNLACEHKAQVKVTEVTITKAYKVMEFFRSVKNVLARSLYG
jgi:hypothetical protein